MINSIRIWTCPICSKFDDSVQSCQYTNTSTHTQKQIMEWKKIMTKVCCRWCKKKKKKTDINCHIVLKDNSELWEPALQQWQRRQSICLGRCENLFRQYRSMWCHMSVVFMWTHSGKLHHMAELFAVLFFKLFFSFFSIRLRCVLNSHTHRFQSKCSIKFNWDNSRWRSCSSAYARNSRSRSTARLCVSE